MSSLLATCLLLVVLGVSCEGVTIMEALSTRFDLITFTNLLRVSNIDKVLQTGNHIVFVPTDAVFNRLPEAVMRNLHDSVHHAKMMHDFLAYHVINYTQPLTSHWNGEKVTTLQGKPVRLITYDTVNKTLVNGLLMKESNLQVSNGHIYLIDELLSPPPRDIYSDLQRDNRFSTFLTAVTLSGMRHRLQEEGITVLAPTNDAFLSMNATKRDFLFNNHEDLQEFVRFHIVSDLYFARGMSDKVLITPESLHDYNFKLRFAKYGLTNIRVYPGSIAVEQSDWLATNGVIHVLSHVILPWQRCSIWM